ncbi:MAG: O-antigen ligase family protein [Methylobacterium frigidaeris]
MNALLARARPAAAVLACLAALAALALVVVILRNPLVPLLLIAAALAVPPALLLAGRPLLCLCGALVLMILPIGLRLEPLHTLATNGMLVAALGAWLWKPGPRGHWSATCVLLALLIAWAAVTVLWAPDPGESRRELIAWAMSFTLLFLFVNQVRSLRSVDGVMLAMAAYGWMIVLASLYTVLFTGYDFVRRLRVLDMNENMLGLLLILMLPGVIWPVLRSTGARRAILMALSVAYILFTLAFVALSGSRGSAISIVLILFTFLFARSTRPWGFVGFGLVASVALAAPFLLGVIIQRFTEEEGGEMGGRGDLWEASLGFIAGHPLTGAGVGNGPLSLHDSIAAVSSVHNHRMDLPSHQPVLEVGVDVGLVGIALYLAAILAAFLSFARSRAAWAAIPGAPAGYHMVVAGTTAGYLMSWFKGGGLKNHPTFFLLLALLLLPAHLARAQGVDRGVSGGVDGRPGPRGRKVSGDA